MQEVLAKLEFDKIRERLVALSSFPQSRSLSERIKPQSLLAVVEKRLDETQEALELLRFGEPSFLQKIGQVEAVLKKLETGGILQPEELAGILNILRSGRLAERYVEHDAAVLLKELLLPLLVDLVLENDIGRIVDEDGYLKDDASPALKDIRRQILNTQQKIKDFLQEFIRSSKNQLYLQDSLVTERSGRYVIPVKQEYKNEVNGIIHDESSSGATVFIEPLAVVQQQNKIRSLESEERREIQRILTLITEKIVPYTQELKTNLALLATFDHIIARGKLAYEMNAYKPLVNQEGLIEMEKARHPLLGEKAVPIDVTLGKTFSILVITGPNTGGKTVVLKTVGLLTVMAMCGLYIPAREGSKVSIFHRIFVDIGDEQSIEQSLSTFSAHMNNLVKILRKIDRNSLVLLDELGSGTDPVEGAALGQAILETFLAKSVHAVVTTHQSALKDFAYQQEQVENACVEFDPVTLHPTYRLTIGRPGQSNALAISGQLGLAPSIIERARVLMPEQELEMGNILHLLTQKQSEYEIKIKELEQKSAAIKDQETALATEKAAVLLERDRVINKAQQEAAEYVKQIKLQANEALEEIKQMMRRDDQSPPKFHELDQSRSKLKNLNFSPLKKAVTSDEVVYVGDQVEIADLYQQGYVLSEPDNHGEVLVQVGSMKLNLKKERLLLIKRNAKTEEKLKPVRTVKPDYLSKVQNISPEIDLRGQLADEAIYQLDKYINEATLAGLDQIRIIHGKGTGALRKAIQEYLRGLPYILQSRDGHPDEGGNGVTITYFK